MNPIEHLVVATKNKGKAREFRELLRDNPIHVTDLSTRDDLADVIEDGVTFRDNACVKAIAYATTLKQWCLADDSGLAVDALNGRPGVFSARWAAMHNAGQGDLANNALLLSQLADVKDDDRSARFVCVLALANPKGHVILTCQDAVEGAIILEPRGENGFGYDSLFLVKSVGKTTAELEQTQKHEISHRGKAMRRMVELMKQHQLLSF